MLRKFALLFLIATPALGQDSDGIYRDPNWLPLEHVPYTNAAKATVPKDCDGCLDVVTPDHWHLLTKSRGGTISLLKNLTQHECQFARARALKQPATPEEIEARKADDEKWFKDNPGATVRPGGVYTVSDGDIETAECFE